MFAIEYIKQNISNSQLSVERIADEMNISSTYLRRIFTEITGVSPLQYIKNMRINLASDILCTKEISIADTAAECGFHDVSYFCKECRKIIGCTPLAFKKKQHVTRAKI